MEDNLNKKKRRSITGHNGGGTLYPMEKGETRNPHGRAKKYTTLLKEHGYKLSEIEDTIKVMLTMTPQELKTVWDNPVATILEKTIANALIKSLGKGSLYSIETLLSRSFGKPRETTDVQIDNKIEVVFVEGKTIL